ncbi:MAG: serine protease [Patescibacteria group bacterium]
MNQSSHIQQINILPVCAGVRAVGLVRPRFDPIQQGFLPPQLDVIGTAFLLKGYEVIITCEHVVRDFVNNPTEIIGMLVIGKQGIYFPVSIDSTDFAHDLAILRFRKNPNITDEKFKEFLGNEFSTGLELTDRYPDVSTKVGYAGYPMGTQLLNQKHDPTYSEGVVGIKLCETDIRKEIRITGPVAGGFSGSPIVLKESPQKVIAALANSPTKEAGDANIFSGISWEHIKAIATLAKS